MVAFNLRTCGTALAVFGMAASASSDSLTRRADTSGCGITHNVGFNGPDAAHTVMSGGINRTYAVYVPATYNKNTTLQRKLILDFHGHNDSPADQFNNSKYYTYTAGADYLAVYPAGVNGSWQSAPYSKGVNDTLFVYDLLKHLRTQYCIDSNHIYASGKSNGGGFVDFLACSNEGDEFSAFAMASAALYSDNSRGACSKKRAILESHGVLDGVIPYNGGMKNNGTLPNIDNWVSWWGQRDGCSASASTTTNSTGYEYTQYTCNGLSNVVGHYRVDKLGHCWPTSTTNYDSSMTNCNDTVLDYTPKVLSFFSAWNKTNAPAN